MFPREVSKETCTFFGECIGDLRSKDFLHHSWKSKRVRCSWSRKESEERPAVYFFRFDHRFSRCRFLLCLWLNPWPLFTLCRFFRVVNRNVIKQSNIKCIVKISSLILSKWTSCFCCNSCSSKIPLFLTFMMFMKTKTLFWEKQETSKTLFSQTFQTTKYTLKISYQQHLKSTWGKKIVSYFECHDHDGMNRTGTTISGRLFSCKNKNTLSFWWGSYKFLTCIAILMILPNIC